MGSDARSGFRLVYTRTNALRGLLIFTLGDSTAALIAGELSWTRVVGVALLGSTLYAVEVPSWFAWIDRTVPRPERFAAAAARTLLALAFFNPVWIARHLFFLKLFALDFAAIDWDLYRIGAQSFAINAPVSLVANFLIQNRARSDRRFLWSASFSAATAIYYSLSEVFLR